MKSYKHLYSKFVKANQGKHHFTCHSHHYWPDVTFDAIVQYWQDSAQMVDDKWDHIFSSVVPETQSLIAKQLNTQKPEQLVFAPNTHEFVYRLMSCFELTSAVNVLTTDSEFYSFSRQIKRLSESPNVTVTEVETLKDQDFESRFIEAITANHYDIVFLSHVFFNSGVTVSSLERIVNAVPDPNTMIVIDGYHGFMAIPTDLSRIEDRVFYLSGGYKYAQAGEGCCFMHVPENCQLRPRYTGWFAEFGELAQAKEGQVNYSLDGNRFAGATMDYSAVYKLRAVLAMCDENELTVNRIHQHVKALQERFLTSLSSLDHPQLNMSNLIRREEHDHGHFLTFELDSAEQVQSLANELKQKQIYTDFRGNRIRFGFALYHDLTDCDVSKILRMTE